MPNTKNVEAFNPAGESVWVTLKAFEIVYAPKGFTLAPREPSSSPAAFVPGANIPDVVAWVDGIPERAALALEAELERKPNPRPKLLEVLEPLAERELAPAAGSGDAITPA